MTRKGGSMSSNTSAGSGILTVILVVLVTLKLTGTPPVAQWSWWWVLAPFWAPALVILAVALAAALITLASSVYEAASGWMWRRKASRLERAADAQPDAGDLE